MTIKDFFQGIFSFPIADEMINAALYQRIGMSESDNEISEIDLQERELILADILIMLSRASQGYTNQTGSDAFSMTIKGETIPLADRQAMRAEANRIYRRYSEETSITESNAINI